MTWHLELNDPIDVAELSFDQLSPEEKEGVVSFYNSQNMNIGSPLTEASLPQPEIVPQGTQGAIVSTLQEALNNNGANLVVDGVAGPRTIEAAAEFQRNNDGLTPDGLIGAQTIGALVPATPVAAVEEETNQTEVSTSFATIISGDSSTEVSETPSLRSGFDSLVEAEGTSIHLDGRGFLTLPYGIVPDANSVKKADGTAFDPTGSHGLTASNLSGVDYAGATKFGISKTSYDTDEAFAKAVYSEFATRTASKYGEGFDGLTDVAKQAAYDMAWNAGIGSAGWSSVKTMLDEASKEGTKSTDSLIGFTTNFRSGSDYPRGLFKRRLQTYNLVANEGEEASAITTSAVSEGGVRTGTTYTAKTSDGTVLATYTKPDNNEKLGTLTVE